MSQGPTVAVVGATGAVGREILSLLEERNFPIGELRLLASARSTGKEIKFRNQSHFVKEAKPEEFEGCQLALFSAGSETSKKLAPSAWERGCVVIDNSSAWRMDPDVPLVVPEVNPEDLDEHGTKGIVGNPNCSTIQMVHALKPLHDAFTLRRVIVSTYQSASGAGQKGMSELSQQTLSALNMKAVESEVFPHQLAFNVLPHIDVFEEDGFTREEHKMIFETRKILNIPKLAVSATCVRVPVFCGHSESVYAEFEKKVTPKAATKLLSEFSGIEVLDNSKENLYPTPLEAAGKNPTYVGRIRQDPDHSNGIHFWVVADNLRKGAALNAVQIAEIMVAEYLF